MTQRYVTYIYALIDPKTGDFRYVGKANDVRRRFRSHRCAKIENIGKFLWLQELWREGLTALTWILETCPIDCWGERERFWIARMRNAGCNLFNIRAGGTSGGRLSEAQRARLSAAKMGHPTSLETRSKISASKLGQKQGPHSAEWRARISASHLGKKRGALSAEHKTKIATALRGRKLSPERVAKSARNRELRRTQPTS